MTVGPVWSIQRAFAAAFAERRIYLRTDARTRYLSLGTTAQIAGATVVAMMLGWSGFTTFSYVDGALDGHAARSRLETLREAYEARIAALDARQRALEEELQQADLRRDAVTERLSEKQARLVETANRLHEADAELAVLRTEYETLNGTHREDQARAQTLAAQLARAEAARAQAETAKANLADAFDTFSATFQRVIAERDGATGERSRLAGQVADLSGQIDGLQDRETRLLDQLEGAAQIGLAGLDGMFSRTNLNVESILKQARRDYTGAGGPFEPLPDAESGGGAATAGDGDQRVAALMRDLETVNLMRFAADRLPFGEPVHGARLTSDFGPRRDPKGRGMSMHEGVDLAGPRGTAIYTTADGVVTFAGREHGYGLVVKIRHAFGFETVYAHLSRARVKVGQRVVRGDRVADMGSTGRSTGTHLHYEVRIDNEPVNPLKFIEAARDVL